MFPFGKRLLVVRELFSFHCAGAPIGYAKRGMHVSKYVVCKILKQKSTVCQVDCAKDVW